MLDWNLLLKACALVFVFEGLLLLLGPGAMKKLYADAARLDEKKLRWAGLGATIAGVILLNLSR